MNSGEAHGWLLVGAINDHLWPEGAWRPDCCGPCAALQDYFLTPRGRAEAQVYLSCLPRSEQGWLWAPDGVIDWPQIEQLMNRSNCPNHEE